MFDFEEKSESDYSNSDFLSKPALTLTLYMFDFEKLDVGQLANDV
jgi:hypothetical protein